MNPTVTICALYFGPLPADPPVTSGRFGADREWVVLADDGVCAVSPPRLPELERKQETRGCR